MGVWSNICGTIAIKKDNNISIRKCIEEQLTDEFSLEIEQKEQDNCWKYKINCSFEMDGDSFIKVKDKFFRSLRAESIDVSVVLRFIQ